MPSLIDVDTVSDGLPDVTLVEVGDLIVFTAPGGVVESGTALEPLAAFSRALPGPGGRPLVPQGPPNVVLFRAARVGEAGLRISTGDVCVVDARSARARVTVT